MTREPESEALTRPWWAMIFRDIHFWVPVAVLLGGLLLLRWIH